MSYRFDNRSKDEFKKQIYFSTMVEKFWWEKWVKKVGITNWSDNGCANDGSFIESGDTGGADYICDIRIGKKIAKNLPVEIKWVPTPGKISLKEGDLKRYIKDGASILFILNMKRCGTNLRLPKENKDIDKHLSLLESKIEQIKWALMLPKDVEALYEDKKKKGKIKAIPYMGFKPGIVLKQSEYDKWFDVYDW